MHQNNHVSNIATLVLVAKQFHVNHMTVYNLSECGVRNARSELFKHKKFQDAGKVFIQGNTETCFY